MTWYEGEGVQKRGQGGGWKVLLKKSWKAETHWMGLDSLKIGGRDIPQNLFGRKDHSILKKANGSAGGQVSQEPVGHAKDFVFILKAAGSSRECVCQTTIHTHILLRFPDSTPCQTSDCLLMKTPWMTTMGAAALPLPPSPIRCYSD